MLIHGKCHCGNIVIEMDWTGDWPEVPARACGCSFCIKHGAVWTAHPDARLAVIIHDAALASKYAFGTRTAVFHVCAQCGGVPLATSEIGDSLYAVVNVNTLEGLDQSRLRKAAVDFDDESLESRLARRKRNWISHVRITENGA